MSDYGSALEWLFTRSRGGAARDPARMSALVEALGLSEPAKAAHVVGTNGKGTVTSMIAAGAAAAGMRSGAFISPHVEEFRERITVDGKRISEDRVIEFVERVRSTRLPVTPAFFELTLALALDHFAREGVDFAAFEAGVGARHDATAILRGVTVSVLTPIALDHLETLGPTLADIAGDKSAVIRPRRPAVSAAQEPEVEAVLRREAALKEAPLHLDDGRSPLFELPATATSQRDPVRRQNCRLAAAALRLLGGVSEDAVAAGLAIPPLPGRAERFEVNGVRVLLDGAHDPAAAAALARRAEGEFVLLFGSLRRKQGMETLAALEGRARAVVVTNAGGEESTVSPAPGRAFVAVPEQALAYALNLCRPGGLLVIAGSLYLAGELRPLLRDPHLIPSSLVWSALNLEAG